MGHESLRPYVADAGELYEVLGRLQAVSLSSIGYRMMGLLALLTVGLLATGAVSQVALCLSALMAFSVFWAIADHVSRDWFMHMVALHDVMRPRSAADLVAEALIAEATRTDEALREGANGQAQG